MRRNDLGNVYSVTAVKREQPLYCLHVLPHPIAFRTEDFRAFRSLDRDTGSEIADGKSDAAKAAAEAAAKVEKAKMQPSRNGYGNAGGLGNSVVQNAGSRNRCAPSFSNANTRCTLRYPVSVGNRAAIKNASEGAPWPKLSKSEPIPTKRFNNA
jgi:hypothetical protein